MPLRHVVAPGESIPSLAVSYGFDPHTVWNSGDNAELREKRGNMNILLPGDVVVIPDRIAKSVPAATGATHRYRRVGIPSVFRLQLFDGGTPRANEDFTLTVDGREYSGTTDGRGVLAVMVPPGAKEGSLLLGEDEDPIALAFGHLHPAGELSGIQKRLCNLGHACEATGTLDEPTRAALLAFQGRFGLPETGEADDATRKKLVELHDTDALLGT